MDNVLIASVQPRDDEDEASMHRVLKNLLSRPRVSREDFAALVDLMPVAVAVGAAATGVTIPELLGRLNSASLHREAIIRMADYLEAREAAH